LPPLDFDIGERRAITPGGNMTEIEKLRWKRKLRRESVYIRLDKVEPRLSNIRQVLRNVVVRDYERHGSSFDIG